MELERGDLVSPTAEVPVVEGEIVTAIRELADRGWGSKAIARELGVARNTVRRYRAAAGRGRAAGPSAAAADRGRRARGADAVYEASAEHNAVVVHRLLRDAGPDHRAADGAACGGAGAAGAARRRGRDGARRNRAGRADADRLRREARARSPARPSRCFCWSPCSVIRAASS